MPVSESEAMLRNMVAQLMAAVRLICIMGGSGRNDVVDEIKSCLSDDMTYVAHSKQLDRVIKAHLDVLDNN